MLDYPGPNLDEPPDDRVYGYLNTLAARSCIQDHVEQVIRKTSDEKPCLISCKPMATRLVPSQCILPLFDPVFNLSTAIVNRNCLVCFKIRVGHNKSVMWGKFTHMPFDLTDNLSGLMPALSLVMELNDAHLYTGLWWTTGGSLQSIFEGFRSRVLRESCSRTGRVADWPAPLSCSFPKANRSAGSALR